MQEACGQTLQDGSNALLANLVLNIGLGAADFCFCFVFHMEQVLSVLGPANDQDKTQCVPGTIYTSRNIQQLAKGNPVILLRLFLQQAVVSL